MYKLEWVGVQGGRWDKEDSKVQGFIYFFAMDTGMKIINGGQVFVH